MVFENTNRAGDEKQEHGKDELKELGIFNGNKSIAEDDGAMRGL